MNEEANKLLDKLAELEEAPLIWINKKVYEYPREIERLNNIINELERYLNNYDLDYFHLSGNDFAGDIIEEIKNKLKELKENK